MDLVIVILIAIVSVCVGLLAGYLARKKQEKKKYVTPPYSPGWDDKPGYRLHET